MRRNHNSKSTFLRSFIPVLFSASLLLVCPAMTSFCQRSFDDQPVGGRERGDDVLEAKRISDYREDNVTLIPTPTRVPGLFEDVASEQERAGSDEPDETDILLNEYGETLDSEEEVLSALRLAFGEIPEAADWVEAGQLYRLETDIPLLEVDAAPISEEDLVMQMAYAVVIKADNKLTVMEIGKGEVAGWCKIETMPRGDKAESLGWAPIIWIAVQELLVQEDRAKKVEEEVPQPVSLALRHANAGFRFMQQKNWEEAIKSYDWAASLDSRYKEMLKLARKTIRRVNRRGLEVIRNKPYKKGADITMGEYWGW